jgi:hypothetical protein
MSNKIQAKVMQRKRLTRGNTMCWKDRAGFFIHRKEVSGRLQHIRNSKWEEIKKKGKK